MCDVTLEGSCKHKGDDDTPPNSSSEPKSVEDLLEITGGFSWFQIFASAILILPEIPCAMVAMSPILTGSTTINCSDYSCLQTKETNLTEANFCQVISNCTQLHYGGTPYRDTIVKEWNLFCDQAWIADLVTSAQMAGSTLGALAFPYLSDRYGRRELFFIICLLIGMSGILTGWAPSVSVYAGCRFASGLCVGGLYVVYVNYLMEFLVPRHRAICGCVTFWAVGEMGLALLGYLLPAWRHLSIVVAFPFLVIPLAYKYLPESPRWLLCHHRTPEAETVFKQIADWNGRPCITYSQLERVQAQIALQNKATEAISHSEHKGWAQKSCSIFKRTRFRRQFFFLIGIWFLTNLIYYGLSFNTRNLAGDQYLNLFYLGISELPGPFTGYIFSNRYGRKKTIVGFMCCSAILLTVLAIVQLLPDLTISQVGVHEVTKVLVLAGRFCNAAGIAVVACTTAESFPTKRRLTYAGICCFFGNIGGILAPQLVLFSTIWTIGPYLTFGVMSIIVTFLCVGLKETAGEPLYDDSETGF